MHRAVEVLLVEDDPGDVKLTKKSFSESRMRVNLTHVPNGLKAIEYLRQSGEYERAVRPDLIIMDLNMPIKDGRKTLEELKGDKNFRKIPIVILTTSDADTDIIKTYDLGANCFITKPVDYKQFQKTVDEISDFWFSVVKLPNQM